MKTVKTSKIVKNNQALTPIGGRVTIYFKDLDKWDDFREICKENNLKISHVIDNFVTEFNNLNG